MHRPGSRGDELVALAIAVVAAGAATSLGTAHADEPAPSSEAQAAASRAGDGVSADTYDAENLVYFLLYGGANLPSASRVVQHRTGGATVTDDDVSGSPSWLAGLGLALIPPRFDWFACETHVELGVTTLDARLGEGEGAELSLFTLSAGVTFRATVPMRYFSLTLGGGPLVTTFVHDFADPSPTPDQPASFETWDEAFGLRLLAGVHFLIAPDVRLFVETRHDLYMDTIGQPPESASTPFRGDEVDGLTIHSVAGGLEVNVPEFQQSSMRGKTPFIAVPIIAVLVVGAIGLVPLVSED